LSRRRIATLFAALVAVLGLGAYMLADAPPGAGFLGFAGIVCVLLLVGLSGPRDELTASDLRRADKPEEHPMPPGPMPPGPS